VFHISVWEDLERRLGAKTTKVPHVATGLS